MMDNMAMDRVIDCIVKSLIPTYAELDGYEFVVSDMVYHLVSLDQIPLAVQVLEELGSQYQDSIAAGANWRLGILRDAQLVRELDNTDVEYLDTEEEKINVKEILDSQSSALWLKMQVCSREMNNNVAFSKHVFANTKLLQTPKMVRNLLKNVKSEELARAWSDFVRNCTYELDEGATRVLPLLASNGALLSRLWKDYRYHVRHGLGQELKRSPTLNEFLAKAISLDQTITCSEIVRVSQGQFDAPLISWALQTTMWGKKRCDKYIDDQLYRDPKDEDTALIQRIVNSCSQPIVSDALCRLCRRLDSQYPEGVPGRILWNLVVGVNNSVLDILPPSVERAIAPLMVKRPHLEQLRYMSLPKVTSDGVMRVVECSANKYRRELGYPRDISSPDMRALLLGLVIVKEKAASHQAAENVDEPANQSSTRALSSPPSHTNAVGDGSSDEINSSQASTPPVVPQVSKFVSKVVLRLFDAGLNENETKELITFLESAQLRPTDDAIVRCIGVLLHRKMYRLSMQVLEKVPDAPPDVFYRVIVRSSVDMPRITLPLIKFFRKDHSGKVPSWLLRRVAIGFARSPYLTDSQAARRIAIINSILRRRSQKLGPVAATALVDNVLDRAERRGAGSRERLNWALAVARDNDIDHSTFAGWNRRLSQMRASRRGFWAGTRMHIM
jgi:hypothetical protein